MRSIFEVVAEPHRRQILELLRGGERAAGELVERLGIAQPTVSKHLKLLREHGLVSVRQDAQRRVYRLSPEPLRELESWLAPYRVLWADRLSALGHHLDEMP
ncbi:ArsR/SmtB family transcription factor [Actinophytocola sp.]|uniref:ArsR/SmtB family transcription factor n=1 Tax=Actinophytocola sp. TaxID=1872138 RepID=UPI0038998F57